MAARKKSRKAARRGTVRSKRRTAARRKSAPKKGAAARKAKRSTRKPARKTARKASRKASSSKGRTVHKVAAATRKIAPTPARPVTSTPATVGWTSTAVDSPASASRPGEPPSAMAAAAGD